LQSQLAKTARKRLSLSGLELLHGRLDSLKVLDPEWPIREADVVTYRDL
jgi:hypothetical protein